MSCSGPLGLHPYQMQNVSRVGWVVLASGDPAVRQNDRSLYMLADKGAIPTTKMATSKLIIRVLLLDWVSKIVL